MNSITQSVETDTRTAIIPRLPATDLTPVDELRAALASIEMDVLTSYTLADAIREGCSVTDQKVGGYGAGREACAMSAAMIAARARGYLAS